MQEKRCSNTSKTMQKSNEAKREKPCSKASDAAMKGKHGRKSKARATIDGLTALTMPQPDVSVSVGLNRLVSWSVL